MSLILRKIRPLNLYEDIYNMNKRIIAAKATSEAILSGNLDASRKLYQEVRPTSTVRNL